MNHRFITALSELERMLLDESAEPKPLPLFLLEHITSCFSDDKQIGEGGFAKVYKGILGNGTIAVKRIFRTVDIDAKKFTKEILCLSRANHKNIVRFLGYCSDTQDEMIIFEGKAVLAGLQERLLCFEYLPKGSLEKQITDASCGLKWRKRYEIINGICDGLYYLRQMNIIHLDLKPDNILLDNNMVPKICDFGLSRCFDDKLSRAIVSEVIGTRGYMAPEFLLSRHITYKSDIYSLGIIMIRIITGENGYPCPDIDSVLLSWRNRLDKSEVDTQLVQVRVCTEIAMDCTEWNADKRPDIDQVMNRLSATKSADESANETGASGSSSVAQVIDSRSMRDKKQYTSSGSLAQALTQFEDDSSLHSGSAHPKVIDDETTTVPPNSDDSSLHSGTRNVEANDGEESGTAPPISGSLAQALTQFEEDSSLPSGSAHVEVIDDETTTVSPNSDDSSLLSGTTHVEVNDEEESRIAPPISETRSMPSDRPRLDLVVVADVTTRLWMNELKAAMFSLVLRLSAKDRLSVVLCAATKPLCPLCPLREMTLTNSARREWEKLINHRMESHGNLINDRMESHQQPQGNNIGDGLVTGLMVLAERKVSAGRVAAIFLAGDNQQNPGKALDISAGNVPVYTFGLGTDSKHTVLSAVAANSTGSTFSHVLDFQGRISVAFFQCLAHLLPDRQWGQPEPLTDRPLRPEPESFSTVDDCFATSAFPTTAARPSYSDDEAEASEQDTKSRGLRLWPWRRRS